MLADIALEQGTMTTARLAAFRIVKWIQMHGMAAGAWQARQNESACLTNPMSRSERPRTLQDAAAMKGQSAGRPEKRRHSISWLDAISVAFY